MYLDSGGERNERRGFERREGVRRRESRVEDAEMDRSYRRRTIQYVSSMWH